MILCIMNRKFSRFGINVPRKVRQVFGDLTSVRLDMLKAESQLMR